MRMILLVDDYDLVRMVIRQSRKMKGSFMPWEEKSESPRRSGGDFLVR